MPEQGNKSLIIPRKIYSVFLDIFFPKRCVECNKPAKEFVCYDCVKKIEKVRTSTCPGCGKISKFSKYCPSCKSREQANLTGLISATRYEIGPVKEMIHHLKYLGITELAEPLGELVVERLLRDCPLGDLIVVPVPLHKNRESSRGFNQSELIARYVSKRLNIAGGCALERTRNTVSQVSLVGKLRRINLAGAFRCCDRELIENKTVFLIDDVATTGTTLNECAGILRQNGAKKVYGVVVARKIG